MSSKLLVITAMYQAPSSRKKENIPIREAASRFGYSTGYLSNLCRTGKVIGTYSHNGWLVDAVSLERFVKNQTERKEARARELAKARAEEYKAQRPAQTPGAGQFLISNFQTISKLKPNFKTGAKKQVLNAQKILRSEAFAVVVAVLVVGGGAVVARGAIIPQVAESVFALASETADGFRATFGEVPGRITARVGAARSFVGETSARVAMRNENLTASIAVPIIFKADALVGSPIAFGASGFSNTGHLARVGDVLAPSITVDDVREFASGALAIIVSPEDTYRAVGERGYGAIANAFAAYRALIDDSGARTLALAASTRDAYMLAIAPLPTRLVTGLGEAVIGATHAAIQADVSLAYGTAAVAPASARATVAFIGNTGDRLARATERVPALATAAYLRVVAVPAELAPALASAVFDAEYRVALPFARLLNRVEQAYLALIHETGRVAYSVGGPIIHYPLSIIHQFSIPEFSNIAAAVQDAYLGALGHLALALESQTYQNLNNAIASMARNPQVAAVLAALAPRSFSEVGLSPVEQVALATYQTINGWFNSTTGALATLFAPPPTIVMPELPPKTVAIATSTPQSTSSLPTAYSLPPTVSYPTYVTSINGVSINDVNQLIATERTRILATVAGMVQPVANQTVQNIQTIQQVNMIQDLTDLIVRNGDFRGGTLIGASNVTGTNATFTNLTASTLTASDLTSGTIAATGALTSYTSATAPYFVATSTTATSTFAGGLTVGTNKLVVDSTTGNVGIGTTTPSGELAVSGGASIGADYNFTPPTNGLIIQGNLGIGTTTPSAALAVSGDFFLTGSTTITGDGKGLTFTGTGNHDITAQGGTLRIGSNTIIGNIQALDSTVDIGTPATRFDKIYANEVNASTIVGTLTGGNLIAETFTINSDNVSPDQENSYLAFHRGTASPNALLTWNSAESAKRFELNHPLFLQDASASTTNTTLSLQSVAGQTGDVLRIASSSSATTFFTITGAGNVGIGTTTPSTKFSVGGAAGDTTGHGYFTGGLGVGVMNTVAGTLQTAGAATFGGGLTVNGLCVAADTRLRRRRRKKRGEAADAEKGEWEYGEYIYDEVMVKDVSAGDEIASMDQITGRIVWSRVNALMFMGTKEIWTLRTASNRVIRTTANHPYFVRTRQKRAEGQKLYRFEVDMSMKIEDYTSDSFIGVANAERAHVVHIPKAVKQSIRDSLRTYGQRRRMLSAVFAAGIVEAVSAMPERVHELVIDYEYSGYEAAITSVIKAAFPHIGVHFEKVGKKSPAHIAGYKALRGRLVPQSTATETALRKNAESALRATFSSNLSAEPPVGPQALSLSSRIFDGEQFVKEGVWIPVKEIRLGREIAVVYGEGEYARVAWESVVSIAIQRPEPVYDIEIEGTHNFVGNGIVAHNTAVFNNASTTQLSVSDTAYFPGSGIWNSTGNVGIGTTTPGYRFVVQGTSFEQWLDTTTNFRTVKVNDGIVGLLGNRSNYFMFYDTANFRVGIGANGSTPANVLSVNAGTSIGSGYYNTTAPSNGLIVEGNVGIGTTSPVSKLSVLGESALAGGLSVGLGYAGTAAPTGGMIIQGNVGIGIEVPSAVLDVRGAVGSVLVKSTTATNYVYQQFSNAGGEFYIGKERSTSGGLLTGDTAYASILNSTGTSPIQFGVNNAVVMTMLSGGNVGIGTTSPWGQLSVNPNGITGPAFVVGSSTATNFIVTNGGNVGIGTVSPGAKLDVVGSLASQAVFSGWDSVGGASTQNGSIDFGTIASAKGVVHYESSSVGKLYIDNTYNNNAGSVIIRLKTAGTAINAATFNPAGTTINADTGGHVYQAVAGTPVTDVTSTGIAVTGTLTTTGNVGIGTSTPQVKLHIAGTNAASTPTLGATTGGGLYFTRSDDTNYGLLSGITGTGPVWLQVQRTDGTATAYDLLLNPVGGNVGIGTTTPGKMLDVQGDIELGGLSGAQSLFAYNSARTSYGTLDLYNTNTGDITLQTIFSTGDIVLLPGSSGNVGIGTTAPYDKLDILTGNNDNIVFYSPANNQLGIQAYIDGHFTDFETYAPLSSMLSLQPRGGFVTIGAGVTNGGSTLSVNGRASIGSTYFALAAPTNGLIIEGNVGIGTTSPFAKVSIEATAGSYPLAVGSSTAPVLTVLPSGGVSVGTIGETIAGSSFLGTRGDLFASGSVGSEGYFYTDTGLNVGGVEMISSSRSLFNLSGTIRAGAGAGLSFQTNALNTEHMVITTTGNVGIGTTSPAYNLTVSGVNPKVGIRNTNGAGGTWSLVGGDAVLGDSTFYIRDEVAGDYKMTILASGNVGIGTTSPGAKLDVYGSALLGSGSTLLSGDIVGIKGQTRITGGTLIVDTSPSSVNVQLTPSLSGYATLNTGNTAWPMILQSTGGNVGIGTSSPQSRLAVSGGLSVGADYNVAAPTNGAIIQGNVGIGTNNPQQSLHVYSATAYQGILVNGNGAPSIGFARSGTNVPEWRLGIQGTNGTRLSISSGAGNTNVMSFAGSNVGIGYDDPGTAMLAINGNVGIGTTSPVSKLSVLGESALAGGLSVGLGYAGTAAPTGGMIIQGNVGIGTTSPVSKLSVVGESAFAGGASVGIGYAGTAAPSNGLIIQGNVGIGTTSPYTKFAVVDGTGELRFQNVSGNNLTVTGTNATIIADSIGSSYPGFLLKKQGVAMGFLAANDITGIQLINAQGSGITVLDTSGNVGIGTTSPVSKLSVVGESALAGGLSVGLGYAGTAAPTNGAIIQGNVGIGTGATALTGVLDVYGPGTADGMVLISTGANISGGKAGIIFGTQNSTNFQKGGIYYSIDENSANRGSINFALSNVANSSNVQSDWANQTRMTINYLGNVGIGTTNPNEGKLEVKGGTVCVDTNSDDSATSCIASESDERLKTNVLTIGGADALAQIGALRPVSFDWKYNDPEVLANYPLIARFALQPHSIGLIAQEAAGVVPEAIMQETLGLAGYLQLDYTKLVPVLLAGVKELDARQASTTAVLAEISPQLAAMCVTGDTKLRVRRRKKSAQRDGNLGTGTFGIGVDDWEYLTLPIAEVLSGDEVLSLNERTGILEYRQVAAVVATGVQEVYELVTKSGRRIRTTSNHPFLARLRDGIPN